MRHAVGILARKPFPEVICLVAIALGSSPAFGDDTDQLIERVLKLSGLRSQVDQLAKTVLATIPVDSLPDLKTTRTGIPSVIAPAGRPILHGIIHQAVKDDFNREQIERVIAFYSSKVGLKVARITEVGLEPYVLDEVREGRTVVARLTDTRRSTLERILAAEEVAESNAHLLQTFVRGLLTGYRVSTGGQGYGELAISSNLEAVQAQISKANRTQEVALAAYACMFRSLSDDELDQLALYCQSDAASWFRRAVRGGLQHAVLKIATDIGERMAGAEYQGPEPRPGKPGRGNEPSRK